MTYHLLLALDTHHAHLTATIDWGWERMGPLSYRNTDAEEVRIIRDQKDVHGKPRGFKVYLGGLFYQREDWPQIKALIEQQGGDLIMKFNGS